MPHKTYLFLLALLTSSTPAFAKQCKEAIWFYKQKLSYQEIVLNDLNFPKAEGEVTGDFLIQPGIRSNNNELFKKTMGRAITQLVQKMNAKLETNEEVTTDDIKAWFTFLALARRKLALAMKSEDAELYGLPMGGPHTRYTYDNVVNDRNHVHYYVFNRIRDLFHAIGPTKNNITFQSVKIEFKGKSYYITLSGIQKLDKDNFRIFHNPNSEFITLGYEILADILNNRKFYQNNLSILNLRITQAVFILMHHTRWVKGTPSIVESKMEAILRAAFGLTHPSKKTSESFWNAMAGLPINNAQSPSGKKLWGFFLTSINNEKPAVFEYGSSWGRGSQ